MKTNSVAEFLDCLRLSALLPEVAEQTDGQLLDRFVTSQDDVARSMIA